MIVHARNNSYPSYLLLKTKQAKQKRDKYMAFSQPDKKTVGSKSIEPAAFFYVNIKVIGYRASTTQNIRYTIKTNLILLFF